MVKPNKSLAVGAVALIALLTCSGCLQVELTVALHENDGGATVTERIRISRKLQDACTNDKDLRAILAPTKRAAALERAKTLAADAKLVSHKTETLPDGSLESVAVYRVAELTKIQIPNPYPHLWPLKKRTYLVVHRAKVKKGQRLPHMALSIRQERRDRTRYGDGITRKSTSPADRQMLRDLQPVLCDMLSDFEFTVRARVPTRFTGGRVRDVLEATDTMTILSFSGRNGDARGGRFIENEEIFPALLEIDRESGVIHNNSRTAYERNYSVPVLRDNRFGSFTFFPTRYYADKYLDGKMPPK
jgi:hypothetical protein